MNILHPAVIMGSPKPAAERYRPVHLELGSAPCPEIFSCISQAKGSPAGFASLSGSVIARLLRLRRHAPLGYLWTKMVSWYAGWMGIFLSLKIVFGLPGEGIVSIDLSPDICLVPSSRQIQHTGRPSLVQIIVRQIMAKFIFRWQAEMVFSYTGWSVRWWWPLYFFYYPIDFLAPKTGALHCVSPCRHHYLSL